MTSHMTKGAVPAPANHIPSTRSTPPGKRRRFSEADKRRIVEEADRPGASVSDVARRHGIAVRQLFRWKQELAPAAKTETTFLPVTIMDVPDQSAEAPPSSGKFGDHGDQVARATAPLRRAYFTPQPPGPNVRSWG